MAGDRLQMFFRKYSLARKMGWIRLAEALGIVLQAVIMGELLFFAVLAIHATATGARVFRYMGY